MNTSINMDTLKVLPFADYRKELKKDKKFIKKAGAVLFIYDHLFSDGKKGLGVTLFKKPKAVKDAFKKAKAEWKVATKDLAAGNCWIDSTTGDWHIEIKLGNCTAEKIEKKVKLFSNRRFGSRI
jgi:hypothetical protein